MRVQTSSNVVFAATMMLTAACGDDTPAFVDAAPVDASAHDAVGSSDGGEVDASTEDGMPDAVIPDAATPLPDAMPQQAMWRGATRIEMLSGSARVPVVAMDGMGRAIAAWINNVPDAKIEDRSWGELRVSHFDPATGWGPAMAMSSPPSREDHVSGVSLAVNASGEAMMLWYRSDGSSSDVIAQRYTPAGGWLPPTVLYDAVDPTDASGLHEVAIASDGTAIAVWSQRDGLDSQLYARRFVPATGWEPSIRVHAVQGLDAIAEDLAMDERGGAVLVWTLRTGGTTVWASRFSEAGGWSAPVQLDEVATPPGSAGANRARLAVDPAGNAIVAFTTEHRLWGTIGLADGTWQPATPLSETTAYATEPDVAVDAAGNAIVTWQDHADGHWDGPADVRARRFTPGAGWSAVEVVESLPGYFFWPRIAMTSTGIATVAWTQRDGGVFANRFVPGSGWGTPVEISTTSGGVLDEPSVTAGGTDSAIVVWPHDPSPVEPAPFDVWANVYR